MRFSLFKQFTARAACRRPREKIIPVFYLYPYLRTLPLLAVFAVSIAGAVFGDRSNDVDKPGKDAGMVLVPAGAFLFGTAPDDVYFEQGDVRERTISLPAFRIDIYEYPNMRGKLPVVDVNWYEAASLCEERGKRLCSEEEWEKACRGPGGVRFPYGNDEKPDACSGNGPAYPEGEREPSGNRAGCVSGYGVYDMSGNVNEWTSSLQSSASGPGYPVLRGGDYGNAFANLRCSNRDHYHRRDERFHDDGFRCCKSSAATETTKTSENSEREGNGGGG